MKADALLCPPVSASLSDNPEHTEGITTMPQPLTDEALAAMAAGVELKLRPTKKLRQLQRLLLHRQLLQDDAQPLLLLPMRQLFADLKAQHEAALTTATAQLEKFVEIARNSS